MKLRGLFAVLAAVLLLTPVFAQEAKKEETPTPERRVTRIFEVRYQNVDRLAGLLSNFGATMRTSPELKAITVAGPPDVVTAVGEAIKRFDVPLKNVELTAYLMAGMSQAVQQENVPKDLEGVAKQLRSLFAFQGFRVIDTLILRGREGQPLSASGTAAPQASPRAIMPYNMDVNSLVVSSGGKESVIKVDRLRFRARVPIFTGPEAVSVQYMDTNFNTDLDVREGQKVVVGKSGIGNSNEALILVVTAKVVE